MSEEAATAEAPAKEFDAAIKDIGDKIVGLTLIQAKDLTDLSQTRVRHRAGGRRSGHDGRSSSGR